MQVAVVTGASGGIGSGCAIKLAEMGMAVLVTGRNAAKLAEVAELIGDPDRVAVVAVDLADDDAPQRITELAVEKWGRIDFLVNVAWKKRIKTANIIVLNVPMAASCAASAYQTMQTRIR